MTRDAQWGLFAPTTFYDGQGLLVRAEVGASSIADLGGATICVQSGTTTELNLADAMAEAGHEGNYTTTGPGRHRRDIQHVRVGCLRRGHVATAHSSCRDDQRWPLRDDHVLLEDVLSKEPLGPVAPLGDDQWFNVVKWTVFATIEAEELGITQANVAEMATSSENPVVLRLLGADPEQAQGTNLGLENDWVVGVISAVGNYGEIFDRNVGPETPLGLDRGSTSSGRTAACSTHRPTDSGS